MPSNPEKAKAQSARYYAANREKALAENRKWHKEHPEWIKAWRAKNKHRFPEQARRRTFGISGADFARMFLEQEECCAICRATKSGGTGGWHLDHDHAFDKKDPRGHRGILCSSCNRGLGYFKDNYDVVRSAATYLLDQIIKLQRAEKRAA
jgi:hypothetical protein